MKEQSGNLLSFFRPLKESPTNSSATSTGKSQTSTSPITKDANPPNSPSPSSTDVPLPFKRRQKSIPSPKSKLQPALKSEDTENRHSGQRAVSGAAEGLGCTADDVPSGSSTAAVGGDSSVPAKRRRIQSLIMEGVKEDDHGDTNDNGSKVTCDENHTVQDNNSASSLFKEDGVCKQRDNADDEDDDEVSGEEAPIGSDAEQPAGAKRVWADSKAGKMLLSSLQPKKSVTAVQNKSLFGQGPSTKSSNVSEPGFDPSMLDGDVLRPKLRSKSPIAAAKAKTSILFALLVESLDTIERLKGSGTGSKKLQAVILANTFRILLYHSPEDLIPAIYICMNKTAPDYANVELGVGEAMLVKAVTETYGRSLESIRKELAELEDLGAVAANSKCSVNTLFEPQPLTIAHVFAELKSMPDLSGASSTTRKRDKIKKLLVAAKGNEPKYIIRFLQGNMRIGAQKASVFQAIAFAFVLSPRRSNILDSTPDVPDDPTPTGEQASDFSADVRTQKSISSSNLDEALHTMEASIRTAFSAMPDIEKITQYLLKGAGPGDLARLCVVTTGIPLEPMLAKPTKGLKEVFARFSNCRFTCEYKYDGERAQVHKLPTGVVKVFSRNLEDMTEKYPDIVLTARTALGRMRTAIVDCEAVAFDTDNHKILPFQVLQGRKRKAVKADQVTVQVCLFAFDCILLNDEPLVQRPLIERRALLEEHFVVEPGKSALASHTDMTALENVDSFLQEALDAFCEGIMVKTLDVNASYEPSRRSLNWLKVKKDYIEGLGDSVDLVPIGAFQGSGKRAGTWGTYLLAVYNSQKEVYQTVCKAATGFADADLLQHYTFYQDHTLPRKPVEYEVHDKLTPDVWLAAVQVWECKAADLSISPVHSSGIDDDNPKGIGLRFPRFLRIRDDKKPQQATTHLQINQMYQDQFESGAAQAGQPEDEASEGEDD